MPVRFPVNLTPRRLPKTNVGPPPDQLHPVDHKELIEALAKYNNEHPGKSVEELVGKSIAVLDLIVAIDNAGLKIRETLDKYTKLDNRAFYDYRAIAKAIGIRESGGDLRVWLEAQKRSMIGLLARKIALEIGKLDEFYEFLGRPGPEVRRSVSEMEQPIKDFLGSSKEDGKPAKKVGKAIKKANPLLQMYTTAETKMMVFEEEVNTIYRLSLSQKTSVDGEKNRSVRLRYMFEEMRRRVAPKLEEMVTGHVWEGGVKKLKEKQKPNQLPDGGRPAPGEYPEDGGSPGPGEYPEDDGSPAPGEYPEAAPTKGSPTKLNLNRADKA